ncbi:MAG: ATP-binding protein [Verrucomicrobiia bacterium]
MASRNKVRLLFGARQTGKTSLLRHAARGEGWVHYNLQDSALRLAWEANPSVFTREVRALPRSIRCVVVDEIQKAPALLDEVQALHDEAPHRFQFYLTGSSARKLRARSANLLPGRSHLFRIHPLVRGEVRGVVESWSPPVRGRPIRAGTASIHSFPPWTIEDELLFGSLPGIRLESRDSRRKTLAAYVETYLEEEIRHEGLVREMGPFTNFLRLAAIESGRTVNLAKLSQESGVAISTLKNFLGVLVDTFVGTLLPPYRRSARRRLLTTPRFYFFDLGVRNAAARLPLEPGILGTEGGAMLEHWVGLELLRRADYAGPGHSVSSWRTADGAEVDFVWESPGEDLPIEVKWTANPSERDARHLRTFLELHPTRARRGLLICRCRAPMELGRHILAVPWDRW